MNTPVWFQYPHFHWNQKHAIIIGGGIAGCQLAWHLCDAGWQVTLIERHNQLATEASGNPAGVISPKMTAKPSAGEDFYTASFDYTHSLLSKLKQQGQAIKHQLCGVLQLAHNRRERKRWQALKDRDLPPDFIQLLDEKETSQIAGIDLPYPSSYFPKGGWINPATFGKALSSHPNCQILKQTDAITLKKNSGQWQVLDAVGGLISEAEVAIIANGKDLFGFEQSAFLPSMPVAGQTTRASASDYSATLKTVIGHEGYLTPAINDPSGKFHIFGATFERDKPNPQLNPEADIENLAGLQKYLPEFANSLPPVQSAHTAVRMTTPDRYPYMGGLPEPEFYAKSYHDLHQGKQFKDYPAARYQEGLFVLGGLGSRGVITSGLCAKILSDLLENKLESEQSLQLLQSCHPARFLIKNLKRNILNSADLHEKQYIKNNDH